MHARQYAVGGAALMFHLTHQRGTLMYSFVLVSFCSPDYVFLASQKGIVRRKTVDFVACPNPLRSMHVLQNFSLSHYENNVE